jgi:SAM-dependent methyltransferase
VLVEVHVAPLDHLPFADGAFDLVVIHSASAQLAAAAAGERVAMLRDLHRVLRQGGRLLAIEPGTTSGLKSMLRSTPGAPGGIRRGRGHGGGLAAGGVRGGP